jgi:hypothetical protein
VSRHTQSAVVRTRKHLIEKFTSIYDANVAGEEMEAIVDHLLEEDALGYEYVDSFEKEGSR